MKDERNITLQLFLVLLVLLMGLDGGYKVAKKQFLDDRKKVSDTVVVKCWDTVIIEKPTEVTRYVVRYDTVGSVGNPDEPLKPQIDILDDSTAIVPIEQVVYSDSTENARYTAYVSGFRPALDSIQFDCRNIETVITNTVEKKQRKFGVGLQLGVGVSSKGIVAPYVGVGVHYNLW